jgi:hypothetical protein
MLGPLKALALLILIAPVGYMFSHVNDYDRFLAGYAVCMLVVIYAGIVRVIDDMEKYHRKDKEDVEG